MRKLAAVITAVVALAAMGVLWMLPVTISVLGTTGPCGPAVYAAFSDVTTYGSGEWDMKLQPLCKDQGLPLTIAGGIVGSAGVAVAAALFAINPRRWPAGAERLRREVALLHPAGQAQCPTCRVPFPCPSAWVILASAGPGQ